MKAPAVYIISNFSRTVLYTGVTSNLLERVAKHKFGYYEGFAKKYKCMDLLHFEQYEDMETAILREKQIKGIKRARKLELIKTANPNLRDLYEDLLS